MNNCYGKVVLITGASSGIGKTTGEYLARQGFMVYGTSRKPQGDSNYLIDNDDNNGFFQLIQLDVCSDESVENGVNYVLDREGRIDILINNAGFVVAGAVEETTAAEAHHQFDTNFYGVLRMCYKVLPIMRSQNKGLIINISSMAGLFSIPFQSMYSASKYALEAVTEALRMEVKPYGIRAVLIEPGDTKTAFTDSRQYTKASHNSSYGDRFKNSVNIMIQSETRGAGPEQVVKSIYKIIRMKNPPVRIMVGGINKLFGFLKRILPYRVIEFILGKMY